MTLNPRHPSFVTKALDHDGVRRAILQIVEAEVREMNQKLKDKENQIFQLEHKHACQLGKLQFKLEICEELVERLNKQINHLKNDNERPYQAVGENMVAASFENKSKCKHHFKAVIGDLTAVNFALRKQVERLSSAVNVERRESLLGTIQNVSGRTLKVQVGKLNRSMKPQKPVRLNNGNRGKLIPVVKLVRLEEQDKSSHNSYVSDATSSVFSQIERQQLAQNAVSLDLAPMDDAGINDLFNDNESLSKNKEEKDETDLESSEKEDDELSCFTNSSSEDNELEASSTEKMQLRQRGRLTSGRRKFTARNNIKQRRNTRFVNTRKIFLCGFCKNYRNFPSLTMLGNHIKKVHKQEYSSWLITRRNAARQAQSGQSALHKKGKNHAHGYSDKVVRDGKELQRFICKCGKSYEDKSGLTKHLNKLTTGKLFSCPECNGRFYQTCEVKTHMKRKHNKTFNKFGCRKCGSLFDHMNELQIHRVRDH